MNKPDIDALLNSAPGSVWRKSPRISKSFPGTLPAIDSTASLAVGIPIFCGDCKKIAMKFLGDQF